jgi:hemerythrin superfamily protein
MGILYNSMKLKNKMKKEMVIERLHELGVKEHQGKSVQDIEYKELLTVLVLAEMKQVDIEHPDHKWFR